MQPEKGEINSILTGALKAESNSSDGKDKKSFLHSCKISSEFMDKHLQDNDTP